MRGLAIAVLSSGCMMCPDSSMEVSGGAHDHTVQAGDTLVLRAHYGDWTVAPEHCGGFWYVNHVAGGTAEVGTVDDCGHYTAPKAFVPGLEQVVIEVSDFDMLGGCADCCPYAVVALEPR